jgi:citrate lyase beta subunit
VEKALEVRADVALFDLEDSVRAEDKDPARTALSRPFAATLRGVTTAIRINALATYEGLKDLLFLVEHTIVPDILVLPKALLPGDPALAASIFAQRELTPPAIFCIIETAHSLWSLRTFGDAPRGLSGLMLGSADLAADLGIPPMAADLRFLRQEIALAARRFGVAAIDSPCFQLRNEARLRREVRAARRLAFDGKVAIHPAQVAVINELFTPSAQALDQARRLVDGFESNPRKAILELDEAMVGPPFVKYARRVLSADR